LPTESVLLHVALFVTGALAIYLSGGRLAEAGTRLAARLGVGATALGLFGLAVITSLPELTVTLAAMLRENTPNLALGNILGSNNFNATTIALLEVAFVGGWFLGAVDGRRYTRTCVLLLVLTGVVAAGVLFGASMPPVASVLVFGLPIVAVFVIESAIGGGGSPLVEEIGGDASPTSTGSLVARFVVLAAIVVAAGFVVAISARQIADHEFVVGGGVFRLGQTFTGTLFVAVATSLPEVSVALGALRRAGSTDVALGTLLGSNSINVLIFAIGAPLLMLKPGGVSAWGAVSRGNMVSVVVAAVLTVFILLGLRPRLGRSPAWVSRTLAAAMVPIYLVGLFLVYRGTP